jgi:hypothetical protein
MIGCHNPLGADPFHKPARQCYDRLHINSFAHRACQPLFEPDPQCNRLINAHPLNPTRKSNGLAILSYFSIEFVDSRHFLSFGLRFDRRYSSRSGDHVIDVELLCWEVIKDMVPMVLRRVQFLAYRHFSIMCQAQSPPQTDHCYQVVAEETGCSKTAYYQETQAEWGLRYVGK